MNYTNLINEVRSAAKSLGLPIGIYDKDNSFNLLEEDRGKAPYLPSTTELDNISANDLSIKMTEFSAWYSYLNSRHTEYYTSLLALKEQKDLLVSQTISSSNNEKPMQKKAKLKSSEEYQNLQYNITYLEMLCNMIKTEMDNAENIYKSLSRIITARLGENTINNRDNNHNFMRPKKSPTIIGGK